MPMKRTAVKAALGLLAASLAVPALWATTAVERSETDLIQEATLIVTGRCTGLQSTWIDGDLATLATIAVGEVLKGAAGAEITLVLPGGIDANRPVPVATLYPAAPEVFLQESVLLFLVDEERVANGYAVAGFSQGKFTLVASAAGEAATQNLGGLRLARPDGQITRGTTKTISLKELRARIEELAAGAPR
jgi:hypothetical protein